MQYDPEHLKQLLSFIERIYNDKDCGEFAAALRGIVGAESSSDSRSDSKIDKIEQYLALDYELDSVVNHDYDNVLLYRSGFLLEFFHTSHHTRLDSLQHGHHAACHHSSYEYVRSTKV